MPRIFFFPFFWGTALLIWSATACSKKDATRLPTFGAEGINMVISHPAGTLLAADASWPCPGYWGTIPSTLGEDGQALSCLMLGSAVNHEPYITIVPAAAVQWNHEGNIRTVVVGWPASYRPRQDYLSLRMRHDPMRQALELWLRHEIAPESAQWIGWQNEVFALKEIDRSTRRFNQTQTPAQHGD
jgi:inorganic pyrophosphatase